MLSPGVVTILCHGEAFFAPDNLHFSVDHYVESLFTSYRPVSTVYPAVGVTPPLSFRGPAPEAADDFAATQEEMPVTFNILSNDRRGQRGNGNGNGNDDDDDDDDDDEDDDDYNIDPATVDLNPDAEGIQSTNVSFAGTYSVNDRGDLTFIPVLNFAGPATIQYTVGSAANERSNRADITIDVENVNDAPIVSGTGTENFNAVAGEPVAITLEDLIVNDPDNQLTDLVLTILPGEDYQVSGNTITPDADYSGDLPVQVQVGDGEAISSPFTLTFHVTRENVAPQITGQNEVTMDEDASRAIVPGDLLISDPDEGEEFTVEVQPGDNYTVSGQTVTPAPDFNGMLTVPVTVNDGESSSAPFNLQVSVTAVNDLPAVTGQVPDPLAVSQNQPFDIVPGNLEVTDVEHTFPDGFTVTVADGANYSFAGNTVTPAAGHTGSLNVNVDITDPDGGTVRYAFRASVAANAPPQITGQAPMPLTVNEDASLAIAVSNLMITDPDSEPSSFTLAIQSGANYSVSGDVITPTPNYHGPLTVPVTVSDGISSSQPFNLAVTVANINDAPAITGHVPLSTPENTAFTLQVSHLTVTDADNESAFTLSIVGGNNYAVSGNVITPADGFNGPLSVPVYVTDAAGASSAQFPVTINVSPVNNPPVITGQARDLQVSEGSSIALSVMDVTISDPDNSTGFTVIVQPGDNYSYSGTTVTPAQDYSGPLKVAVVASDGSSTSAPFSLSITVLPVNDPPRIDGQIPISIEEDTQRTIDFSDLIVSDPDNTYPAGFTMIVSPGAHYSVSGNTITPELNYSGPLSVAVQVNDGAINSNLFNLVINVVPVNDKPVITGQVPVETAEDTPVTILATHLAVLDVDNVYPTGFTLIVSPGANYTVSGNTITPAVDFNGTLNVGVVVNDGISNSDPFTFQIQVGDANDAPVITGQSPISTNEESPVTLALSHLTVFDPDNAFPNGFTLLVSSGANYTVSGTTITPALNFAGTLTIPVRVNDGVNNSPTFDLQLVVNQVNDPPSFAAIANQQVPENTPARSVTITNISKGPQEDYQQLTFVASSSNAAVIADPAIQYNGTGTTAVLSYVVKPNTSGIVTITVVAIDNGSNTPPNANSYSSTFQVEVVEINTAPTLNTINNITIMEDAEQQNVPLSGISAGPGESQTLTLAVSANRPEYFDLLTVAYTSPSENGLLQFKTKPDVSGTAEVTLTVTDNGPGAAPHINTITRKFSIIIQPVNDPPVFTSQPPRIAVVDEQYTYQITARDPDGDKVAITAPVKPSWLAFTNPAGNGQATLSGTPPAGVLGDVAVTLQINDGATSVQQNFTIYVNVRPTLSVLSVATEEDLPVMFSPGFFAAGYADQNENAIQAVTIGVLPVFGTLLLNDIAIQPGDTIASASFSQLRYVPHTNFFGSDRFAWNAFDGYHFSKSASTVDILVLSVNDAPEVVLAEDTLHYEVNGEAAFLEPLIDIIDPDDDTLTHATVAFHSANYRLDADMLQFQNTANVRGSFDFSSGVLEFNGVAPISEYRTALRSIRYLHQNTLDPLLEPKVISFSITDGETSGETKEKTILLQYTFVEFDIPSGFTPNGDQANDTWVIDRPGGGLEEMTDAIISIYNKNGVLVHRVRGFDQPWDGTMNGELLPADTYFYTIDLQLRNKKTYKGIVTILR